MNDLDDTLARWQERKAGKNRARTDQSFLVPEAEIAANDYDLSINYYKQVEHEAVEYDPPMARVEKEIAKDREELEGLLG